MPLVDTQVPPRSAIGPGFVDVSACHRTHVREQLGHVRSPHERRRRPRHEAHCAIRRFESATSRRAARSIVRRRTRRACWSRFRVVGSRRVTTIALGRRASHEAVYATMEHDLVRLAETSDFRGLDARIRHYRMRGAEVDDKPPEDTNGLYISQVGDRWAVKGDLDALLGATVNKALDAATGKPGDDDTRTPAQRRADALGRICRDAKVRPKTANDPTSRSPSPSSRSSTATSRRPAISPSYPARSAGCCAIRNST